MKRLTELELHLHHETQSGIDEEGAFLVSSTGDRDDAIWLPKSQVTKSEKKSGEIWVFVMPEWLATDKELV